MWYVSYMYYVVFSFLKLILGVLGNGPWALVCMKCGGFKVIVLHRIHKIT